MKIIAFLQNPWFKEGTPKFIIDKYGNCQTFHRRVLAMSATGKALMRAFGRDLYGRIVWDNACPHHGSTRRHAEKPDFLHMARRVAEEQADVILLFGAHAQRGWDQVMMDKELSDMRWRRTVLRAPHPMAMGNAAEHLRKISRQVKALAR